MVILHIAELGMASTVNEKDKANFLTNTALAVYSTHHTVLKTLSGTAILIETCCLMSLTLPIVALLISQYRLDIPMGTQGQKGKDLHINSKQS